MEENILQELFHRLESPWKKSGFALYFAVVVVLFGGAGIWLSIFRGGGDVLSSVSDNLFTYSIALFVPAFISIVLPSIRSDSSNKYRLSLVLLVFLTLFIEILLVVWYECLKAYVIPAILSTILSWVFWVIANYDNESLTDKSYDSQIKEGEAKHAKNWTR